MSSEQIKYDFDSNMNYLLNKNLENQIKNEIALQDKFLNSDDFNTSFKYIEQSLNFLYEKNRTLQDIIEYTNMFLKNEINNTITECKTLMASIEEDRDLIKNNSYVKYAVPFNASLANSVDRDNGAMSDTELFNTYLTLSTSEINNYVYDTIEAKRISGNNNISNTLEETLTTKSYRTFYMFSEPQKAKVVEKLSFKFNSLCKINKINLNTANCTITNVILTLEDDSTEKISNANFGLIKTKYIKAIDVELTCANYIISQINYKDVSDIDFWNMVNNVNLDENLFVNNKRYYYYLFGVDNISFDYCTIDNESSFISKEINIGKLNNNEYITLNVNDSVEKGCIEYYIVDGTELIPILPENQTKVIDEKIFYKMPTRFTIDSTKEVIIKRNGDPIKMTMQEAINKNEEGVIYTVSYTPVLNTINSLINEKIKIKAVIRSFDTNYANFIKNITIKKYGGGKLWTNQL